jgi:hypothetical protein
MFPVSAINVIAIIRMDHCSEFVVSRLSNSKNLIGLTNKKIALSAKTAEPNLKIDRNRLITSADVNAIPEA